jgi:phosphoribosylformylglycinamidine synthase
LGGTALAHVYGQIGNESPDLDDPKLLKTAFNAVQRLISEDLILSGHDRSDGGLIVTLLEMAFAGNCGIDVDMVSHHPSLPLLFSEELGIVFEYLPENEGRIKGILSDNNIPFQIIGKTLKAKEIKVRINNETVLKEDMRDLRETWEETSYRLDKFQANPGCVEEERRTSLDRKGPLFDLSFLPQGTSEKFLRADMKPRVAVLREEGSNGDREMASAFYQAGFEVWDVTMTDLADGRTKLDDFRGIAFVGGFSYADVLDSAKGWAGVIRFHKRLFEQFERFYKRPDTFSLGVCNGCQLMALLNEHRLNSFHGASNNR